MASRVSLSFSLYRFEPHAVRLDRLAALSLLVAVLVLSHAWSTDGLIFEMPR